MDIVVGSRVSYGGSIATVRFMGSIPPWPGEIALGLEWDDVSRGKHNGELNGVKYFECLRHGAGSFVKLSKKCDTPKSFVEAVKAKYAPVDDPHTTEEPKQWVGMTKKIEYVVDPLDLSKQRAISVDHRCVVGRGRPRPFAHEAGIDLSHITRLDLGYNLFTSLSEIKQLVDDNGLISLKELILNGNRLVFDLTDQWRGIAELSLATVVWLTPENLKAIRHSFPDIQRLYLAENELTHWDHSIWHNHKFGVLDLSFNQLKSIENIVNVGELNVSHNHLETLSNVQCISLNVSYNRLSSYSVLDLLDVTNKELRQLKLTNNPINAATQERMFTVQAVGRLRNLKKLNGSSITDNERLDCEIYFMNNLAVGDFKQTSRYKQLCDIHGKPQAPQTLQANATLNSKVISLNIHYAEACKQLKVLRTTTMQKVQLQAAKLYGLSLLEVELQSEQGAAIEHIPESGAHIWLLDKS